MGKQGKRTKKFLKDQLDSTIKRRRDHQKKRGVIERSQAAKKAKALRNTHKDNKSKAKKDQDETIEEQDEDDEQDVAEQMGADSDNEAGPSSFKGMTVDDFLGGGFKKDTNQNDDDDEEEDDGNDSIGDIDELSDDDGEAGHAHDLETLKEKDPEFYKYLVENDKNLLNFGQDDEEEVMSEEEEVEESKASKKAKGKQKDDDDDQAKGSRNAQVVTLKMLAGWQKSMLQHRSIKALRRLLLAFRSAVRVAEDDGQEQAPSYMVEDAKVFNKIVLTTLKYTPAILQHHVPVKTTADGKYKMATNTKKWSNIQKPILSYCSSLLHLLETLPDQKMLYVVVSESIKMAPYILSNKRRTREYVKQMLQLWSSAHENVRMAAFFALRKVASSSDDSVLELCLKGVYSNFVKTAKNTTTHTISNIHLMKNSASELYMLNPEISYQQAFGFIRQLAIHLRNCIKNKTKDSYKAVFNWQYVHCVDFWSQVLATSCDKQVIAERGASALEPLIYPLVQVATGVIDLVLTSRYFPFRFHLLRSLMRLISKTNVYIPILPSIVSTFDAPEFHRKLQGSTLPPLDFETCIRTPTNYIKTKIYSDQLADQACFLMLEFLAHQSRSIAFPELVLPLMIHLKRGIKAYKNPKLVSELKTILDKLQQNSVWIQKQRDQIDFAPRNLEQVEQFLEKKLKPGKKRDESPLETTLRLANKVREQKKLLLQQQHQTIEE